VFGFAVWLGAHEVVMPWIGLTPPTWEIPANEQAAELFGHVLWGLVIGVFYEDFRRRWAKSSAAPIEAFIPHEVVAR
jgi:putative membrane protein